MYFLGNYDLFLLSTFEFNFHIQNRFICTLFSSKDCIMTVN